MLIRRDIGTQITAKIQISQRAACLNANCFQYFSNKLERGY